LFFQCKIDWRAGLDRKHKLYVEQKILISQTIKLTFWRAKHKQQVLPYHQLYVPCFDVKFERNQSISFKPGLPGPKKLNRPNLVMRSFKKGQILKNEKRPNKGQIFFKIC